MAIAMNEAQTGTREQVRQTLTTTYELQFNVVPNQARCKAWIKAELRRLGYQRPGRGGKDLVSRSTRRIPAGCTPGRGQAIYQALPQLPSAQAHLRVASQSRRRDAAR